MGQNVTKVPNSKKSPTHNRHVTEDQHDGGELEDDNSDAESQTSSQGKLTPSSSTKKKKMSLFRQQSDASKRRTERQIYLAQENPEPTFDLSGCELSEVPASVFSLCKVLYKEALILSDNWLSNINNGKMVDLRTVRVLDLHDNELKSLPADLGDLSNLQVLNLEKNRLVSLPKSLEKLKHLQTLNLKGNKLKFLNPSVCGLKSLRFLDISENRINSLPSQLCNVRTLETLVVDVDQMNFPTADICRQGTIEIMKFLCSDCNMEYFPPSNYLLDVLEPPNLVSASPQTGAALDALAEEKNLMKSFQNYADIMDKKKLERIELERQLEDYNQQQASLAVKAAEDKQGLIDLIAEDQNKIDKELEQLSQKKETERQKLVAYIQEVEDSTNNLIKEMLEMNEKAKKVEELLEIMEREQMEAEEYFVVRAEESQNLRKQEVLKSMEVILAESEIFERMRKNYLDNKDNMMRQALEDDEIQNVMHVESILYHREAEQNMMKDVLQRQDQLQKEAFAALQLQKDVKHHRITGQICLIEEELAGLTALEIQRRDLRSEEEFNILAEKRVALLGLLSQLLSEQEMRQDELMKRLQEMEQQRQDGQADYWLVQFQRLMDRKPQALIDQENQLEKAVVTVLQDSNAQDYIPLFARHRISIETLCQITDEDLKQMGVHELGVRKSILRNIQHFQSKAPPPTLPDKMSEPTVTKVSDQSEEDTFVHPPPTAPPTLGATGRQTSVTARGVNSECVVCMDKMSCMIFLYCGHVCTCQECSQTLEECPLCRAQIHQRVKLTLAGV